MQSRFEVVLRFPQRRSEIDIMANILSEACRDARNTHIMHRCNLSYRQLKAYLKFLFEKQFLMPVSEDDSKTDCYQTTTKGRNFLRAYGRLKELMRADAHADTEGK